MGITGMLLFLLTGCGTTLDDKTLSDKGGIWTVDMGDSRDIYEFDSDGELKILDSKDSSDAIKATYSISDADKNYKLEIKPQDSDSEMTIKIPKDNVQDGNFVGLSSSDQSEGETVYSFNKQDSDYLDE